MYIATVPNRDSPPAVLLRESYREGGKVKTRTIANLSKLPAAAIAALRQSLKGEKLVPAGESCEVIESFHHGHGEAVLSAMRRLGLPNLLSARPRRQRELILAMIAARILKPHSKLATTRWWHTTSLPATLGVKDADEDELYDVMDWLLERQDRIESKLAARHLRNDGMALYDLTSSYFEGTTCPLAALGHNRDGKKGKLQVNYGLLTNERGVPVSVSVFKGNSGDPKTLLPQVDKMRESFGIERFIMVGDRGMITQKQINVMRTYEGVSWIAALRPEAIKKLVGQGAIQMGLFDERNLFELTHEDFPGERLVACCNPALAIKRANKRRRLIEATEKELQKIRGMVARGRLDDETELSEQIHKVLQQYKIGKHYKVDIRDGDFECEVDTKLLDAEFALLENEKPERVQEGRERCERHMKKITAQLDRVRQRIGRGQLYGKAAIGVRVGRVINKYKVAKHFKLEIKDDSLAFEIDDERVTEEAALDGIYVIRTGLAKESMSAEDAVRNYKSLSQVERAFRSFKAIDLNVRPIHHRLEKRVRAHIFLCMLAYYVQWHLQEAWRSLLFFDEDQEAKASRDPVAPAKRSPAALRKASSKTLEDSTQVHSFRTLLEHLSCVVKNVCRIPGDGSDGQTFDLVTTPDELQQRAFSLVKTINV